MLLHEYKKLDALGLAELVQKKEVTPLELLNCALKMVSDTKERINSVADCDPEMGRKKANREGTGMFQGVPFLVKEILAYPGLKTAYGSRLFADHRASESVEYIKRMDASGLVTFGNTTSSEFALLGSTETFLHGITRNPWDIRYSAFGSSGGCAAAVAAGIVPMAHAGDGGGSIRNPASVCGLFGFKPSNGRCVPSTEMTNFFADLNVDHCVTKTVRDSAAFLSITEQKGPAAKFAPIGFCQTPLNETLRIGLYTHALMGHNADTEVADVIRRTGELCEDLGHEIIPTEIPDLRETSHAFFVIAASAMTQLADIMAPVLKRNLDERDAEPFTLSLIDWFRQLENNALEKALQDLRRASEKMTAFARRFDVLLCPTLTCPPQKIGFLSPKLDRELLVKRTEQAVGYTPIHNMCGMCAMSVPLFTGKNGLPIGSHFAAMPGAEEMLFGLAYRLEAAAPWIERLPT